MFYDWFNHHDISTVKRDNISLGRTVWTTEVDERIFLQGTASSAEGVEDTDQNEVDITLLLLRRTRTHTVKHDVFSTVRVIFSLQIVVCNK